MSDAAIIWADLPLPVDVTSKSLLSKLATLSDDDEEAWCRVPDLAARVGASERTMQYRLRRLVENGFLRDTGRKHRIGTRDVPIYELMVDHAMVAEELERRRRRRQNERGMAAAPEPSMGAAVCTHGDDPGDETCTRMGAAVCTRIEAIRGKEDADASSAGAREIDEPGLWAEFQRMEAAYPRRGLGNTDRDAAFAAFRELAIGGEASPERLISAAAGYAADPDTLKRTWAPIGLHKWLGQGRWRGFGEDLPSIAADPGDALAAVRAVIAELMGPKWPETLLADAVMDAEAGVLVLATDNRATRLKSEVAVIARFEKLGVAVSGPASARKFG